MLQRRHLKGPKVQLVQHLQLIMLDKTRKDGGEFKEDKKGLEEELDAYKISDQYLEKVSLLQGADCREFEWERDAQLALQARRKARYERGSMKVPCLGWLVFYYYYYYYCCCL